MKRDISCCSSSSSSSSSVKKSVQDYYGKVLATTKDLKTSACTAAQRPPARLRELIARIPAPVTDKFYGCGTPLPSTGLEGLHVLDLGCGSGRDCYLASALVGPEGSITGLDMTQEQLEVAKQHAHDYCTGTLGYAQSNMRFLHGYIEDFASTGSSIAPESVDLIISNCVINLSPDKPSVIHNMFKALKYGGEAYFSDVYASRRLSDEAMKNDVLWGECISGALYQQDFLRIAAQAGFLDCRVVDKAEIKIHNAALLDAVGGPSVRFYSITYRLFKLRDLETLCEDYGQVAEYLGTLLPCSRHAYTLDDHHTFETGRPVLVCGNTAAMLSGESWLAKHFRVTGDRSKHFGLFDCGGGGGKSSEPTAAAADKGGGGGGCC